MGMCPFILFVILRMICDFVQIFASYRRLSAT